MNAKQGFHWKTIEQKPENWEKLHHLIKNSYMELKEEDDKFWDKGDLVIEVLCGQYPDLTPLFDRFASLAAAAAVTTVANGKGGNAGAAARGGNNNKKAKKTPPLSKKQEIMMRVDRDLIKKDIMNIRFDKHLHPVTTKFSHDVNFVCMILVWTYYVLRKTNADPLIVLDAVISINRIVDAEADNLARIPLLRDVLLHIKEEANDVVNDDTYSLLFENPSFLIESTADKRPKSTRLYPEQKNIIDRVAESILLDQPLLMGNQMPTGTGKSFLAVPLAQKISHMKRNKTVLFACSNELVNQDIASTALLGDDLHLWMSALIRDEHGNTQVLLRPYKRCFPAKWKSVYKKEDEDKIGSITDQWHYYTEQTKKTPDIIVADLEACLQLLQAAPDMGNPFVAYIDEFISDKASNKTMAEICRYLPKHTILLSAILPRFQSIEPIVQDFEERHNATSRDAFINRVATNNIPISCAVIDHEGRLRMPHHNIQTLDELNLLLEEMQINPRIRRCYTAKHVFYWARCLHDILEPAGLGFMTCYPDIGKIQNHRIVEYAIRLLTFLRDHFIDGLLTRFKTYRPVLMSAPDRSKIFKEQCYEYEGKSLFISNDTYRNLFKSSEGLYDEGLRWSTIVSRAEKNKANLDKRIDMLKSKDTFKNNTGGGGNGGGATINKQEKEKMISELSEVQTHAMLPPQYVLNTREHFLRYHDQDRELLPTKGFHFRAPNILLDHFNDAFSDDELMMLSSGIGFYDKSKMTSFQRNLIMTMYKDLFFICSCKDIVFGTNLPDLVNVFITKEFAEVESVSILYQLMGRVGRMGRSHCANIILDSEESVTKILSLDSNMDDQHVLYLLDCFTGIV